MSFSNPFTEDLESLRSNHYTDFPEFESICHKIDGLLQNINQTHLVSLRSLLRQHEVEGDASKDLEFGQKFTKVTSEVTSKFKQCNDLVEQLNKYLRDCEAGHEDEDTLRYLRQKEAISVSMVKNSLKQFQNCQRMFTATQAVPGVPPADSQPKSDPSPTHEQQQQTQIQIEYEPVNAEELEQQALLVEEREREINQITRDTQEINDIFSNLQVIIQEQLLQIDNIEDNIMSYSADAQGASRELRRAERYQKRAGGRMLCCLLILVGVFGAVILIGLVF